MILAIAVILAVCSCKKDSENAPANIFTFEYQGVVYNAGVNNGTLNAAAIPTPGGPGVFIDIPSVFGGAIEFVSNGCAYLQPGGKAFTVTQPGCQLSNKDDFGNTTPIDSVAVYLFQSGTLNISFSECKVKSSTDPWTGATHQYQVCRAKGSFELTLINKNQQQIKITNGKVDQTIQF